MSRSDLLGQLKIDPDQRLAPGRPTPRGVRWRSGLLIAALVMVVVAAAGAGAVVTGRFGPTEVRVVSVSAAPLAGAPVLEASGYVTARRAATVSTKVTGRVADVLIEEGQQVREGDVIARLDDSNARGALAQAQAGLAAARANLDLARLTFERSRPAVERAQRMHAAGYLSDQGWEAARDRQDAARLGVEVAARQVEVAAAAEALARRALEDLIIRAPFDGVVTVKAAQPGETVSPVGAGGGFTRTGIGTIVDMRSLEVEVDVAENLINRVRPGMSASVRLNAYPDWTLPASVLAVVPSANRAKATVSVRVGLGVRDARIVPDMGAQVSFLPQGALANAPSRPQVIAPAATVRPLGDGRGEVFVVVDGRLHRRAVVTAPFSATHVAVRTGLAPGDQVVIAPARALTDGQAVRPAAEAPQKPSEP